MARTAATPNEGSPADVLDAGCLAEIFGRLTDVGLCRVRSVCTSWRAAASIPGIWREVFATMHGEHARRWAPSQDPLVDPPGGDEWQVRCAHRRQAASNRVAGQATYRKLPYEMGHSPTASPFYVASLAIDGPWLALGEFGGFLTLYDLRASRRRWRRPHALP